jgi:hypothetical protein
MPVLPFYSDAAYITGSLQGTASVAQALVSSNTTYITTGSISGTQTISGSLVIRQNLTVLGSASITFISESTLNIGTNLITVNTINPGARFGGLAVIDSGSSPLVSASFLYDSIQDEFVFVHKGTSAGAITSSVFLLGPDTYNNLGSETYLTQNRIPKGTGVENLNDSNISDNGTVVSINSNTAISGSLVVSGSTTIFPTFVSPSTAAQSVILVTGSMRQIQTASVQLYGVNITPTMIFTTGSQTQTALRVTPTFSGSAAISSSQQNIIADFGATSVGTQFSVNDVTSGSIYMVNDVSGLPILEALSDWTVNMYNYPTRVFQKTGSAIIITGSLAVSSTTTLNGTTTTNSAFTAGSTSLFNGNITTGVGVTMAFNGGGSGTRLTIGSTSLYKASNSTQTPNVIIAPNGTGGMGFVFDNDNSRGLVFCNGNTGFAAQAARASIRSVAVNNTVGAESGDLVFATSPTATTLTDRVRITSTGAVVISGSIIFSPSSSAGAYNGEIVQFGSGTLTAGQLYFLSSSGTWSLADASSTGSSTGMLGIATGTSPTANGLLVRGFAYSGSYTTSTGSIVYAATGSGLMTITSPSSSNHVVRVVGYVTTIPNTIYFNPDATWVTLA